jgi:signal transduction histidine kinase
MRGLDRFRGFLLVSAALVGAVVVLAGLLVGSFFERHVLAQEEAQTAAMVRNQARQHLTAGDFEHTAAAGSATFQTFLDGLPGVFRIKVFDPAGRIIWSNEVRLIGKTFPGSPYLLAALAGRVTTVLEAPARAEHLFEQGRGYIAEAYVPIALGGSPGPVGVIETYKDMTVAVGEIRDTQRRVWAMGSAMGLFLYLALALVVWKARASEMRAISRLEQTNRALLDTQARLVEKERLAAVGQVVVGLHHSILNPLTGILGALHVLKQTSPAAPLQARAIAGAEEEVHKIERIVKQLPELHSAAMTPYVGNTTMLELDASRDRAASSVGGRTGTSGG